MNEYMTMPERAIAPPEPTHAQQIAAFELAERQRDAYQVAHVAVLNGAGPFWDLTSFDWDNEQEQAIFVAVRTAIANAALTDAERWQIVLTAVAIEGSKCAAHVAEETK